MDFTLTDACSSPLTVHQSSCWSIMYLALHRPQFSLSDLH